MTDHYSTLLNELKEIATLSSSLSLLLWDRDTAMPVKAIEYRGAQVSLLTKIIHKKSISSYIEDLLIKASHQNLSKRDQVLIKRAKEDFEDLKKIPEAFMEKFVVATNIATNQWKQAKESNDYSSFLPHLEKLVDLSREKAELLGYKDSPYDALLNIYERGLTSKKLESILLPLKREVGSIIGKTNIPRYKIDGTFDLNKQEKISLSLLSSMGLEKAILGKSAHPFCTRISPFDNRVSTKFHINDPLKGFYATLHEGGHALYEDQLPVKYFGTPLGEAASFAIHESQSLFWERFVGTHDSFLKLFFNKFRETFSDFRLSFEEFSSAINYIEPSNIRIYSDEVTYHIHIYIRYYIEKNLIDGTMSVTDIPHIWNKMMKEELGITPSKPSEGFLQDVHWSLGYFGYFPSYSLGSLFAAILFKKCNEQMDMKKAIEEDFSQISKFLKKEIHIHGREFTQFELIERACGEKFSINYFIDHIKGKSTFRKLE